ncbi:putative DNA excision repair protein ERCC-6-like 2 [Paratrimastix pyriformis]|uniref:DNA excision repair protein ERCC-6-like 2 n=1 Tax=Paratrimastix pyriformis TaxID=342808 RepID=A0ABQ8UH49_9EUKA|nr:putative DNA excision repair protein ERCC-6-like 2 [Paratrimastix pyriformis]
MIPHPIPVPVQALTPSKETPLHPIVLSEPDEPLVTIPPALAAVLHGYQQEGVRWLYDAFVEERGAILADDMGLGKSLQVIALLEGLLVPGDQPPSYRGPALLVVPASLLAQWEREIGKWSHLTVLTAQGAKRSAVLHQGSWRCLRSRTIHPYFAFNPQALDASRAPSRLRAAPAPGGGSNTVDVVLTSYETLRASVDEFQGVPWLLEIFDECHRLKSKASQVYGACRAVAVGCHIGLTGTIMQRAHRICGTITSVWVLAYTHRPLGFVSLTPVKTQPPPSSFPVHPSPRPLQNRYDELYTLINWAQEAALGSEAHFRAHFAHPIERGQCFEATAQEVALGQARAKELMDILADRGLVLRREKKVPFALLSLPFPCWCAAAAFPILSKLLPGKEDRVVFCPLSPLQAEVLDRFQKTEDYQLLARKDEPCDCGFVSHEASGKTRGQCCHTANCAGTAWRDLLFPCLQQLQKIGTHLGLLIPRPQDPAPRRAHEAEFCDRVFGGQEKWAALMSSADGAERVGDEALSGKLRVLGELLAVWRGEPKNKVLLFSYAVRTLELLEGYLAARGYATLRLDGGTPAAKRQGLIDRFNQDPGVFLFLISTRAGGTGLNLTAANIVVLFDASWNPSADLQAEDRSFRLGQSQFVQVVRLVAAGTLEEQIYSRQIYKQQQWAFALQANPGPRYFKETELFGLANLLRLRTPSPVVAPPPSSTSGTPSTPSPTPGRPAPVAATTAPPNTEQPACPMAAIIDRWQKFASKREEAPTKGESHPAPPLSPLLGRAPEEEEEAGEDSDDGLKLLADAIGSDPIPTAAESQPSPAARTPTAEAAPGPPPPPVPPPSAVTRQAEPCSQDIPPKPSPGHAEAGGAAAAADGASPELPSSLWGPQTRQVAPAQLLQASLFPCRHAPRPHSHTRLSASSSGGSAGNPAPRGINPNPNPGCRALPPPSTQGSSQSGGLSPPLLTPSPPRRLSVPPSPPPPERRREDELRTALERTGVRYSHQHDVCNTLPLSTSPVLTHSYPTLLDQRILAPSETTGPAVPTPAPPSRPPQPPPRAATPHSPTRGGDDEDAGAPDLMAWLCPTPNATSVPSMKAEPPPLSSPPSPVLFPQRCPLTSASIPPAKRTCPEPGKESKKARKQSPPNSAAKKKAGSRPVAALPQPLLGDARGSLDQLIGRLIGRAQPRHQLQGDADCPASVFDGPSPTKSNAPPVAAQKPPPSTADTPTPTDGRERNRSHVVDPETMGQQPQERTQFARMAAMLGISEAQLATEVLKGGSIERRELLGLFRALVRDQLGVVKATSKK